MPCGSSGCPSVSIRLASKATDLGLLLAGCATRTDLPRASAAPVTEMHRKDALWLERVSFGLDSASVESYRSRTAIGRMRHAHRSSARLGSARNGDAPQGCLVARAGVLRSRFG